MKSRLPLLDRKGLIALLIMVVGTMAFALSPSTRTSTTLPAASASGTNSTFVSTFRGRAVLPVVNPFVASITTDKSDYSPGQIVYITGSGFQAGEPVSLQVAYADSGLKNDPVSSFADHSGHDAWSVSADSSGNVSSSWLVEMDSFGRTLRLTADGVSSGIHAETIFTDAVGKDFKQCSNNNGTAGLGRCVWINSIIQQSNSKYFEGMSTLQRLILDSIPATGTNDHVLNFHDDFTKGGIHAYDFLTSWEQGIQAGTDAGVPYLDVSAGSLTAARTCGDAIANAALCNSLLGAFHVDVPVPDDAFVSHDGPVQPKINGYEAKYGNRTIRIYGDAAFTSASFDPLVHAPATAGSDTADSVINYTLKYKSASTNIMVVWGEHIALGGDGPQPGVGWGVGKGASSISGGPYHVSLDGIDGASLGSVDNQLKGADVLPPPPQGSITIVKDAIPDDTQSFNFTSSGPAPAPSPATFTLNDDGGADSVPHTQAFANLATGTYNFAEVLGTPGWALTNISCSSAGTSISTPNVGAGTVSVNLAANDAVTCVFTNTKNTTLQLVKARNFTHGGTRPAADWTTSASGPTPISGAGGVGPSVVTAGTYTLSETGTFTGYTNGTTYSCVTNGGSAVLSNSITLAPGDNAVCTITNTDNPASLQLVKALNFTHGGTRAATDWTTSAAGPTAISGAGGVGPSNVNAGTYTLSETGTFAGYTNGTTYSCVKNGAAAVVSNSISLAVGDTAVCTITNTDNAPSLVLDKIVSNTHGGTAPESSWNLTATGTGGSPTNLSGSGAAGHVDVQSGASFKADTYALAESGSVTGYTNGTTYSCVKNGAAAVVSNSISLAVGDSAVCTITNSDNPASLRLIKALNFTHGGTRAATDWTTSAAGPTPISGAGGVGPSGVNAGTYTLSETGTFPGYTNGTTYSCVKNGAAAVVSNTISLAVGDTAVCTITNTDNPASLQLVKALNYTHGGTRPATDWTTSAAGPTPISGAGGVGPSNVNAGSYTLSESGTFAGYTNGTTYSCVKTPAGSTAGAPISSNSLSLAVGDSAVCTITNTDSPISLTLVKALNFTHGGTRAATDWTTSAAGPTPISGAGGVGPSSVLAGTYTLSETGTFAGYTNGTTYSCVKNGAAAVSSNSISLAVGDTAVCTITNTDNAPSLILDKIVSNTHGGSAPESSWNLTATGTGGSPTNLSGAGAAGHTDVASGSNFKADTYALAESGSVAGYTNGTTYSCVKTPAGGSAGAPVSSNSISLAVGDSAVCSITNSDNPASLQLIKALNYQFGGTRPATDWTTSANGPTPISGAGGVGPSSVTAGTYTLSETGTFVGYLNGTTYSCVKTPAGGSAGAPVSSNSISLAVGDSAVCTITNSDIAPTLKVIKLLVPSADSGLFNLLIDGTARATNVGNNGTTGFVTVNAGSHSVSETAGTATSLGSYSSVIGGDCAADGSITLSLAQNATCTITNRRLPTLIVQKTIMGQSTQFEFTATGSPTNPPNGDIFLTPPTDGSVQSDSQIIQPGSFVVNEVNLPANWLLTDFTCTSNNASGTFLYTPATIGGSFVAGFGDNVLCSFVDNQQGGTTRTQGFWATHTVLANAIWNGSPLPPGTSTIAPVAVIGSADAKLCTANDITATTAPGTNQLMGGFWANVANSTRTTKKRSALDKIRMQFLQQYLAAVLNVHAFGTVIPGTSLATARAAYCGTDTDAIHTQQTLLATYNESGDSGIFTPGASATPGESRLEADIAFWDTTFRLFDPTQVDSGGKVNTTVTTRPTTTKSTSTLMNILVLPSSTDDETSTDPDKPKTKVKRPDQR